jgi:hypothetical protein
MGWWKSACSGGQHRHRCGYLVDSEIILKLVPGNPCATGVPGSRNTSLPETGTKPGATPERRKNRETGTSRGYPLPAAGRLTKSPPGNQRASGQRPGQVPASHTCRGLAYFGSAYSRLGLFPEPGLFPGPHPSPGLAYPPAQVARSVPSAMPRSPCSYSVLSVRTAGRRYAVRSAGDVLQLLLGCLSPAAVGQQRADSRVTRRQIS